VEGEPTGHEVQPRSFFALFAAAAQAAAPSKITRIETVYWKSRDDAPFWPHWTWVKNRDRLGISGIGETYPRNPAEAPCLFGGQHAHRRDPRDIERIWADLYRTFDFQVAGGAEIRALSAIDLALWDVLGKSLNAPSTGSSAVKRTRACASITRVSRTNTTSTKSRRRSCGS